MVSSDMTVAVSEDCPIFLDISDEIGISPKR